MAWLRWRAEQAGRASGGRNVSGNLNEVLSVDRDDNGHVRPFLVSVDAASEVGTRRARKLQDRLGASALIELMEGETHDAKREPELRLAS